MHDLEIVDDAHALAHARGQKRLPPRLCAALDSAGAPAAVWHCAIDLWARSVEFESARFLVASASARTAVVCGDVTVGQAAAELVESELLELVDEATVEETCGGALECGFSMVDVAVWRWLVDATPTPVAREPQVGVRKVVTDAERAEFAGRVIV